MRPAGLCRQSWGVCAAEAPQGRALTERELGDRDEVVRLLGAKCWCSGAAGASNALLTAWHRDGRGPQLVCVNLHQPGVRLSDASWQAVGMAGSASLDVEFHGAIARLAKMVSANSLIGSTSHAVTMVGTRQRIGSKRRPKSVTMKPCGNREANKRRIDGARKLGRNLGLPLTVSAVNLY